MFHERYTANLYVVDLGSELEPLILLAAHDGTDIRTVDAHNPVPLLLLFRQVALLTTDFLQCGQTLLQFC